MRRRIRCLCLTAAMLMTVVSGLAAELDTQTAAALPGRIVSLGIMQGDEDGSLRSDDLVTRAEFTAILVRMLAMEDIAESMAPTAVFTDVPVDHWANQVIALAYQSKLVDGVGGQKFAPEDPILSEEAVKLLVLALGYFPQVEETGGAWYQKYFRVANRIGLLYRSDLAAGTKLTRAQTAVLADSALDIDLMVQTMVGDQTQYEIQPGHTLVDLLTKGGEERYGILEAAQDTALIDYGELRKTDIYIDGVRYTYEGKNADSYVGMSVTYFVSGKDEGKVLELIPRENRNSELRLEKDEISTFDSGKLEYIPAGAQKPRTVRVSDSAFVMLNGRPYPGTVKSVFDLPNVSVRLINQDSDSTYDVIAAENYEIAKIMRVNTFDQSIHLKQSLSNDSRTLKLDDRSDQTVILQNSAGEEITLEDIKAGDTILQITQSYDGKRIAVIWLDQSFAGNVSALRRDDPPVVEIDGKEYRLAENKAGSIVSIDEVDVGVSYQITLDTDGKIVDMDRELKNSALKLGYVYKMAATGNTLSQEVSVKMLTGTLVERVKINDIYYIQGIEKQELYTYPVSSKIRIDGEKVDSDKIWTHVKEGSVFYYSLNSEGEITRLESCASTGEYQERTLNAKQQIMATSGSGFGIDSKTMVFFVPKGKMEEDLFSEMRFKQGGYYCEGFNFVENTTVVEAAVFNTGLDSSEEVTFGELDPYCIVQAVSHGIDEDGNQIYRVSGFREGKPFDVTSSAGAGNEESVLAALQTGDIIRYKTDFDGRINAAVKLEIEPGTKNPAPLSPDRRFFHIGSAGSDMEQIFGVVAETKRMDLDTAAVKYVNRMLVSLNADGAAPEDALLMDVDEQTAPDYYSYEYDRGEITPIAFEDIVSVSESSAEDASRVFAYAQNGTFKIVVVVR